MNNTRMPCMAGGRILRNPTNLQAPTLSYSPCNAGSSAIASGVQVSLPHTYLQDPNFFRNPLSTLIASLNPEMHTQISVYDICEAYHAFLARIRATAPALDSATPDFPALLTLKRAQGELTNALKRDIKMALVDPLQLAPTGTPSTACDSEEQLAAYAAYAEQLVAVCHGALHIVTSICRLTALQGIFTNESLSDILLVVTDLVLHPSLPTPNARKTYSIAMLTLSTYRLPDPIVLSLQDKITEVCKRSIFGELCGTSVHGPVYDGVKVLSEHLRRHPHIFLSPCIASTTSVFQQLVSFDSKERHRAALTVSFLSWALVSVPDNECLLKTIRTSLWSFIDSEKCTTGKPTYSLFRRFQPSTPRHEHDDSYTFNSAMWSLSVVASLLMFAGGTIFSHRTALKLVVRTLGDAKKIKNKTIRRIQGFVWQCLIRAYIQLADTGDGFANIESNCFDLLRQELSGSIPLALVGALLNLPRHHSAATHCVTRVLTILQDLMKQKKPNIHLGIKILLRLVGGVGERATVTAWAVEKILSMDIISGCLLRTPTAAIPELVDNLPDLQVGDLRVLSEEELRHHWHSLFSLWTQFAAIYTGENPADMSALIDIWQRLLLAQAQLTQEHGHLTMASGCTTQISQYLTSLLVLRTRSLKKRQFSLVFLRHLWSTACNVFSAAWLQDMAQTLLTRLLRCKLDVRILEMKDAWSSVCLAMISAAHPSYVESLVKSSSERHENELRRQLWVLASTRCVSDFPEVDWMHMTALLSLSLQHWKLDDEDTQLWESLLHKATLVASNPFSVAEDLCGRIRPVTETRHCDDVLRLIVAILSSVSSSCSNRRSSLPLNLLYLVADTLASGYPPSELAELGLMLYMQIFVHLQRIFFSDHQAANHIELIAILQRGVVPWIEDTNAMIPAESYNDHIISFYCSTLDCLSRTKLTVDNVILLESYLVSCFSHIPPPACGPLAFWSFWKGSISHLDFDTVGYPARIKTCVKSLTEAYGGALPDWMEMESVSASSQENAQRNSNSKSSNLSTGQQADKDRSASIAMSVCDRHRTPESMTQRLIAGASGLLRSTESGCGKPRLASTENQSGIPLSDATEADLVRRRASHEESSGINAATKLKLLTFNAPAEAGLLQDALRPRKKRKIRHHSRRTASSATSHSDNSHFGDPPTPTPSQPLCSLTSTSSRPGPSAPPRKVFLDSVEVPTWKEVLRRQKDGFNNRSPLVAVVQLEEEGEDYESWEHGLSEENIEQLQQLSSDPGESMEMEFDEHSPQLEVSTDEIEMLRREPRKAEAAPIKDHDIRDSPHPPQRSQTAPEVLSSPASPGKQSNHGPLRRFQTTGNSSKPSSMLKRIRSDLFENIRDMETQELAVSGKLLNELTGLVTDAMASKLKRRQ